MSFEGGNFGQDSWNRRGRGRRGRGARGGHTPQEPRGQDPRQEQPPQKKEYERKNKDRVRQELEKASEENRTYTKFQLLEIFSSIDIEAARQLMGGAENPDMIVDFSQNPVLLEEEENKLTLEELRPKKGMGGPRKRRK